MWIDCSKLGIDSDSLTEKIKHYGKLRIVSGKTYGENAQGFIRINIACPRQTLKDGLKKLQNSIEIIKNSK